MSRRVYESSWKEFETAFWETEVGVGRLRYPRSSIFLNHWLVARTGEEVVAREVFDRFKRFATHDSRRADVANWSSRCTARQRVYRRFVDGRETQTGPIDRLGLFGYRTGVLESEVIKPLMLWLLDPEQPPIPEAQFVKALDCVESWMVRRMLVRGNNEELQPGCRGACRAAARIERRRLGNVVEAFLAEPVEREPLLARRR